MSLWIPSSALEGKTYTCEECGSVFPEGQRSQWIRHVDHCAKRNDSEIQEAYEEIVNEPLTRRDDEVRDYIAKRVAEGKQATKGGYPA